ncbi:T9SS C-terminal target domain-containing protein [Flavobacterium arcticum]|uniref:T9SS C-terminal target domain-containing protein n=1 Tax=Flavobacterium arcticum TaxID=1784713 RepID=A0A345HB36_9FLAO|nr:M12 family metallo-peptidase [Flavobacterium arcticum]AXG73796.1 T9SS C-terminal target domain-containing protein [Flavobacterium arcticum]KAF2511748.1 T9SS type A sorting domain-containing protein [Flavobacterium arcticum]
MKKITLIIALLLSVSFYAQRRVAIKVQELNNAEASFQKFTPLIASQGTKDYTIVDNETYATLDSNVLNTIYNSKPETINLIIPYQGNNINISLYKVTIFAEGFHADTDKEKDFAFKHGVFYRGIIKNDNASLASFSFFENEMSGIVSNQEHKNIVIGKLAKLHNFSEYIIYSDSELNVANPFNCSTSDDNIIKGQQFGKKTALSTQNTETDKCVGLYYEIDYDIFQQNFSTEELTANWLTSLFNNTQTLYDNDGINISLKSFFIWTTDDPYFGEDSVDYLIQFFDNYQTTFFDGDLGQLLADDLGSLGGIAFLNGVCDIPNNVSYVDVDGTSLQDVPAYSWSVQASTHELGHQLGSPHTHACVWNGNNTAIDGCYETEGGCAPGPIPTNGGTIMSYCHLSSAGVNLANGFGEQPAQLMIDNVNASNCLSTSCEGGICDGNISNLGVEDSSLDNFIISWEDESSTTNLWDIRLDEASTSQNSGWVEVDSEFVTIQDLQPNNYYVLKVRSVCETGVSGIEEILFATDADWCEGQIFTDPGGVSGNYNENQYIARTFTPTEEGKVIRVTFNSFELEQGFDYLTIYNGATTTAPLINNYTGTSIQNVVTSTAADGSLTFEFSSNESQNNAGWVASVECVNANASVNDNSFNNFTYYPNPATDLLNISAGEEITEIKVYAISGQLLFTKEVNAAQTTIDISALANGVYFFKAVNDNKETNFRVVKQ